VGRRSRLVDLVGDVNRSNSEATAEHVIGVGPRAVPERPPQRHHVPMSASAASDHIGAATNFSGPAPFAGHSMSAGRTSRPAGEVGGAGDRYSLAEVVHQTLSSGSRIDRTEVSFEIEKTVTARGYRSGTVARMRWQPSPSERRQRSGELRLLPGGLWASAMGTVSVRVAGRRAIGQLRCELTVSGDIGT